jgi:hypothetical protein
MSLSVVLSISQHSLGFCKPDPDSETAVAMSVSNQDSTLSLKLKQADSYKTYSVQSTVLVVLVLVKIITAMHQISRSAHLAFDGTIPAW